MIGNDIIDLKLAAVESKINRPRFQQKLFCESEQQFLESCDDLFLNTWLFWAMKEAAYKAHQRRKALTRHYNPQYYQCEIFEMNENYALGRVRAGTDVYAIKTKFTKDYIHCIATNLPQEKIYSSIKSSSINIYSLILEKISELFDIERNELAIVKDRNFVPHLKYQNKIFGPSFSISHHGEFSGFSLSLMNY